MAVFDPHAELPFDPDIESLEPDARFRFAPSLLLAVAIGAAIGAPARYAISRAWTSGDTSFPSATLLVNLLGAFLLGVLLESLARRGEDIGRRRILRLLLGTGFCGAFTTYSALAVEIDLLVRGHRDGIALLYAAVSVIGGLVVTAIGIASAAEHHHRSRHHADGVIRENAVTR